VIPIHSRDPLKLTAAGDAVATLAPATLAAATKEFRAREKIKTYVPVDYFLAALLIGWEVWGGFNTDVEFKDLSLRGWPAR
jgi:hypothetical protein